MYTVPIEEYRHTPIPFISALGPSVIVTASGIYGASIDGHEDLSPFKFSDKGWLQFHCKKGTREKGGHGINPGAKHRSCCEVASSIWCVSGRVTQVQRYLSSCFNTAKIPIPSIPPITAAHVSNIMGQESSELLAVGSIYRGSKILKIDEERSERPNGLTRIRRAITLASGMTLVEDEFKDFGPAIEGEYTELEYISVPSPVLSIKKSIGSKVPSSKLSHKKKVKITSPKKEDESEKKAKVKRKQAEDRMQQEKDKAEENQRRERELKEDKERTIQQEKELQAHMLAEELTRKEEEEKERREAEDCRRQQQDEAELLRRAMEDRLRASQEALRKRKQDAEAKRALQQRKAAIVEKWKPKALWVHSPASKLQRKDQDGAHKEDPPEAIWSYGNWSEPDKNFDRWRPQQVVIHPPGKDPPLRCGSEEVPHGIWVYASGAQPDDDDDEWCPHGEESCPGFILFPPGIPPMALDGEQLSAKGIWTYPTNSRTTFPPLPTPKNEWGAKLVKVHPESNSSNDVNSESVRGQWMVYNGKETRPVDGDNWAILEVQVYPDGHEPPAQSQEDICGVWGLAPGATPDEQGNWKPSDLWFFGPGEIAPDDDVWSPQGVWTHSPNEEQADSKCCSEPQDEWEPRAVWVCPPSSLLKENEEEWTPTGIWSFSTDEAAGDSDDWSPCQVMVYPKGKEPENLEDVKIQGVWGLSPSAVRVDDEDWKPSDVLFISPGETPPLGWKPQGVWVMASPGSAEDVSEDWPPKRLSQKPEPILNEESSSSRSIPVSSAVIAPCIETKAAAPSKAWIFPSKKVPDDMEKGVCAGVWSRNPGKKGMDERKKPTLVDLYKSGYEPPDLPPGLGIWGYAPNAEPTSDGHYLPSDVWFFAPGESPPDDDTWQPQGVWSDTLSEPKKKGKVLKDNPKRTSKKQKPKHGVERQFENSVWVYPSMAKAPEKADKKNPQGCWGSLSFSSDGENPKEILIHPEGFKVKDAEKRPHGVFGYAPGSKPDDEGLWSPKDMLFFPPGESPPAGIQKPGVWSYPQESRIEIAYSYRFEGSDIVNLKQTTIFYMDTSITFTKESRE